MTSNVVFIMNVSNLEPNARMAMMETVINSSPTVHVKDDFGDHDVWVLELGHNATMKDWNEEIDYIEKDFERAKKGELHPTNLFGPND